MQSTIRKNELSMIPFFDAFEKSSYSIFKSNIKLNIIIIT